jgi:hypothetical protein
VSNSSGFGGINASRFPASCMMTPALVTVIHRRARREPAASANNIDHIIKSPPLMSRDAPVM